MTHEDSDGHFPREKENSTSKLVFKLNLIKTKWVRISAKVSPVKSGSRKQTEQREVHRDSLDIPGKEGTEGGQAG